MSESTSAPSSSGAAAAPAALPAPALYPPTAGETADAADAAAAAHTGVHARSSAAPAPAPAAAPAAPSTAAPSTAAAPRARARAGGVRARDAVLALAALGAAAAAGFLWWLSPALVKAWRGKRAPDYPSEAFFSADGLADGCVGSARCMALVVANGRRAGGRRGVSHSPRAVSPLFLHHPQRKTPVSVARG
jgi:hypothetical protein